MSGYLFLLPYFLLFGTFMLLPLFYGLGLSFFRWEMLSLDPPHFIGLGNYIEAAKTPYFWMAMWATLRFVVMNVPLVVIGALIIAAGINALPQRFQAFFRAAYFFPVIISISVAGILWRWFFNTEFGLFNAYLGLLGIKAPWLTDVEWAMKSVVFMTVWWTLGGPMVILLAGLRQIPAQYREAASIDGANSLQSFFYVTLPVLRPVLLFVIIISIIGSFQVFGQTFLITKGGPELSTRVMMQYIYETAFMNYRIGFGAAMSWLLFLVIAIFSFIQFRIMREK
mgnify:CR=1 FL=1